MKQSRYQAHTLLARQLLSSPPSLTCTQSNTSIHKLIVLALLCLLLTQAPSLQAQSDDLANRDCLECHDVIEIGDSEFQLDSLLGVSIHVELECIDCHIDITELEHPEELEPVDCGLCHSDVVEEYTEHGRELFTGKGDLPKCIDCHGTHDIREHIDPEARTHPQNLSGTCANCHEDSGVRERHDILKDADIIRRYQSSVHAQAIAHEDESAATCIRCHSNAGTAHSIIYTRDPRSSLSHFNNPNTCGQCHEKIAREFWRGVHGQLVAAGATDAPVCTDCHGEHSIISPKDPDSPVSSERLAEATCAPCHESARLNEKYGVTGSVFVRIDSYHGTKSSAGDVLVANCASCHGAHMILPRTDTLSSIHPANLQHTCGECHTDISAAVAATPIHETPAVGQSRIAAIIERIYIILIILVVGGMLVHWAIDLSRHLKNVVKKPQVQRMTRHEVWQHMALMVTFIALVLTGFSLRHASAGWVQGFFAWPGGFELRGAIHRVTAIMFMVTVVWHSLYLFTTRGRQFLVDMAPTRLDLRQFRQMIRFNLGRTTNHPEFGRFSYVEKAEYWALVWGAAVMIITGLLLWFENDLVALISIEVFNVALVIHYYEAWLATLAIIVWHLYSTVFSPVVYPMNPAWLTGKMPAEVYRHEHSGDKSTVEERADDNGSQE